MRADNTDAALDFIVTYAAFLRNEIPAAKSAIRALMPDGLRGHTYNSTGAASNTYASPVESTVLHRIPGNHTLRTLDDELDATVKTLRNLLNDCRRIHQLGTKLPPRDGCAARCDGGAGRDGYLVSKADGGWSEPGCNNVPSRDRRTCDACRQRHYRWLRERENVTSHGTMSPVQTPSI